jgi:hypothetical protein
MSIITKQLKVVGRFFASWMIYSTVMRIKNPNRPKERGIWLCDMNLAIGIFSVTNLTPK